jgi:hypothetical protein
MRNVEDLPVADADLEEAAKRLFPFEMSPEEYAARHAHQWYCFSMDDYRYADARIERWIHRLGDILFQRDGAPSVRELREQYLTKEEREIVEAKEREEF